VSAIHQNLDVLGSLAENADFSFVKVQFSLVFARIHYSRPLHAGNRSFGGRSSAISSAGERVTLSVECPELALFRTRDEIATCPLITAELTFNR
jgi:hypothetical protein